MYESFRADVFSLDATTAFLSLLTHLEALDDVQEQVRNSLSIYYLPQLQVYVDAQMGLFIGALVCFPLLYFLFIRPLINDMIDEVLSQFL